ncbi:MAG TPA: lysine--tRNA ligase, partial [Chloroflexi bacterium]|nr:lysine--tRNA ligase [Chloroflexota bacterium]
MSNWQPSPLEEQRLSKLGKLEDAGIEPFPIKSSRSHTTAEVKELFVQLEEASEDVASQVSVCGRLLSIRDMGKTVFAHLEDGEGRIQLFLRRDEIGEDSHQYFRKLVDLGDFIEAIGVPFRTRAGEISIRVSGWRLLSKSISPLPVVKEQQVEGETVRYSAFADVEERYRQRYADLAVNPEIRE